MYYIVATGAQKGRTKTIPLSVQDVTSAPITFATYFAEGYTGTIATGASANFADRLSILNGNNFGTTYTIRYFLEGATGPSKIKTVGPVRIGPFSVVEENVAADVGANQKVAAAVTSPASLAVERTISRSTSSAGLDFSNSMGQQLNLAAKAPTGGFDYYFAAGSRTATGQEYLIFLNPNDKAATVTVSVLPQAPAGVTTLRTVAPISFTVPAHSRRTENLRKDLASTGVSTYDLVVNSTVAIAVEQVRYDGDGIGSAKYGAAVTAAGTSNSVVAEAVSSTPGFRTADAVQATYPAGASIGQ